MRSLQFKRKEKIIRTRLYDDQRVYPWELELAHTPILQRLYDLKQLGFTDRIFPDAIHSRFNHTLGVMHISELMIKSVMRWLELEPQKEYKLIYWDEKSKKEQEITAKKFAQLLEKRIKVIRLIALLHDVTHSAYGHTLEDEIRLFSEKHDNPKRQLLFFDTLVAQLITIWSIELEVSDPVVHEIYQLHDLMEFQDTTIVDKSTELFSKLSSEIRAEVFSNLKDLELACHALLHLDYLHHDKARPTGNEETPESENITLDAVPVLLLSKIIDKEEPKRKPIDFILNRDAILLDLVGNTTCADLIDYARRDPIHAGLKTGGFDIRFFRYLSAVSVKDDMSPDNNACIRSAIQFFSNKMRHDVLSEINALLKLRYLISERMIFHPTKCAAGAMLGTVFQLLNLTRLPSWSNSLGDTQLLYVLKETTYYLHTFLSKHKNDLEKANIEELLSQNEGDQKVTALSKICLNELIDYRNKDVDDIIYDEASKRIDAAYSILFHLMSRRFPKLVYRLRGDVKQSDGTNSNTIAEEYGDPNLRYELQRKIELKTKLPHGSIFIHCPRRQTTMKVSKSLMMGENHTKVAYLSQLGEIFEEAKEELSPYSMEIQAIENMYKSIWQFHVFVDVRFTDKMPVISKVIEKMLGFKNDRLLSYEPEKEESSIYHLLIDKYDDLFAPIDLPIVLSEIEDQLVVENELRMRRFKEGKQTLEQLDPNFDEIIKTAIDNVNSRKTEKITEVDEIISDAIDPKSRPSKSESKENKQMTLKMTEKDDRES